MTEEKLSLTDILKLSEDVAINDWAQTPNSGGYQGTLYVPPQGIKLTINIDSTYHKGCECGEPDRYVISVLDSKGVMSYIETGNHDPVAVSIYNLAKTRFDEQKHKSTHNTLDVVKRYLTRDKPGK